MHRFALLMALAGLAASSLVRAEEPAVVRSARSGLWSQGETWEGGKVPASGVKVQSRPEHAVTYDVQAADSLVIRSLHIFRFQTLTATLYQIHRCHSFLAFLYKLQHTF